MLEGKSAHMDMTTVVMSTIIMITLMMRSTDTIITTMTTVMHIIITERSIRQPQTMTRNSPALKATTS